MKKNKLFSILICILLSSGISFADVTFSGMAGGTTGFTGDFDPSAPDFNIPFNAFAALQFNFSSWGIFRANMGFATNNLANENIFTGQEATLKMNEVSLVLTKTGTSIRNYFGFYLGTYEVVGKDEYLQRHLSIEPFTSSITKSQTTLTCGLPLYKNEGIGFSYVMDFNNAPGSFGLNAYVNLIGTTVPQFNFDLRTAWSTKTMTLDFAAGIGAPLQNTAGGNNVILLIDTIYLHGGLSLLLGNLYTHSLLIQGGIQHVTINPGTSPETFEGLDDFSFILEPRITTKHLKVRLSAFSLPREQLNDLLYLDDPFGFSINCYSDAIPVKNNNMTAGGYLIASFANDSLLSAISSNFDIPSMSPFNASIVPYVILPVANGDLEIMGQFTACDILNTMYFKGKLKVGYRKAF
ncbi:MAG: hypothetical protein KBS84_00430 [Treponema sp.]|nr:hypothetical protein [Candidatus Treponema scatequi]